MAFSHNLFYDMVKDINTAYLGQKFKKETGESVNSFLHKIRIDKATELADKTNMTWREIADAVGYKSYLGFFEHFTINFNSIKCISAILTEL